MFSKQTLAFIGILLLVVTGFIDYMIVNNALPSIKAAFGLSILSLQWISNVYSIVMASSMILFGRLADTFGHRKIFYFGGVLLIIGSLGAGLSHSYGWLLFFRAIQSLGVSDVVVLGPGMVQFIYGEKSHTPMSIFSMFGGLGLLIGPYLGGIIVTHLGWEWVFFINIPVVILGFMVCIPTVGTFDAHSGPVKSDWLGNALLLISLTSLIYGFIRQEQVGFDVFTALNFIIFIIAAINLYRIEKRHPNPTINFDFFKKTGFSMAILMNMQSSSIVATGMFFSPIFLQNILHYSPVQAGTILLSFAIGTIVFSSIIGQVVKSIREYKAIIIGLGTGTLAAIFFILFFSLHSVPFGIIAFVLTGMALAVNNSVSTISAINAVGEKNAGSAIGSIFSTWNAVAAIWLGITSMLFHMMSKPSANSHNPYIIVFIPILVYTIIVLVVGLKKGLTAKV